MKASCVGITFLHSPTKCLMKNVASGLHHHARKPAAGHLHYPTQLQISLQLTYLAFVLDRLLNRFHLSEIIVNGNVTKKLLKSGSNLEIVSIEQLFDVISDAHLSTGHGGRDILNDKIGKSYANVTKEQITSYLQLCETCQLKKSQVRKGIVVKPIISNKMNSRCQVSNYGCIL